MTELKKNKEQPVKLTITDIIKRKEQILQKRNETRNILVKSLDGYITVTKADKDLCMDCLDMEDDFESSKYLLYETVISPNLKDEELHKAYDIENPLDIVETLFDSGEISSLSKECMKLAGFYDSVEVVEDIKN